MAEARDETEWRDILNGVDPYLKSMRRFLQAAPWAEVVKAAQAAEASVV